MRGGFWYLGEIYCLFHLIFISCTSFSHCWCTFLFFHICWDQEPSSRDRATSAERSRSAMVCFWWYTASPVRVLGLVRHVPPIPRLLHLKCCGFSLRFVMHLGIPLPNTCDFLWNVLSLRYSGQVIQSLLVQKGEISDCSYSLVWSVLLAHGSLLLSGSFFLHGSGQRSDPRELSVHGLCSYTYLLRSSPPGWNVLWICWCYSSHVFTIGWDLVCSGRIEWGQCLDLNQFWAGYHGRNNWGTLALEETTRDKQLDDYNHAC